MRDSTAKGCLAMLDSGADDRQRRMGRASRVSHSFILHMKMDAPTSACWLLSVHGNIDSPARIDLEYFADINSSQIGANQKRQAGDCGSTSAPDSTSAPETTAAPDTTAPQLTDLPTLTNTDFSTPSGSTCASTTTFSQCNGSGGQSICVTTSSCASFEATETPTPTSSEPTSTTYEAPLFTSPTVCNNEDDYPGHAPIKGSAQEDLGKEFCDENDFDVYPAVNRNPVLADQTLQDGDDINYRYRIEWKPLCSPEGYGHQNSYNPQNDGSGFTCPIVMAAAYGNCESDVFFFHVPCLRLVGDCRTDWSSCRQQWRRGGIHRYWMSAIHFYWWGVSDVWQKSSTATRL
jgi:hypothetical protein